jgi:hypothetical protein
MSSKLEQAQEYCRTGQDKKAVGALWEVPLTEDSSIADAQALLELATVLRDRNEGSLRRDCEYQIRRAQQALPVPTDMEATPSGEHAQNPAIAPPPRSLRGVTVTLLLALGVETLISVLSIAAFGQRLHVLTLIETGMAVSRDTLVSSDDFVRSVSLLSLPMFVVVLVLLLVWVHAARKNLEAFRPGPFDYTPGMAVGSFFIPFVSFWWPCLVMREIWKGSDPGLPPFDREPFTARRMSPLVVIWWIAFLAHGLMGLIVFAVGTDANASTLSGLRLAAQVQIASRVLRLAEVALTAVLAYRVMRREDALQRQLVPSAGALQPIVETELPVPDLTAVTATGPVERDGA